LAAFDALAAKCEKILREIAREDMDLQHMTDYVKTVRIILLLQSQTFLTILSPPTTSRLI